MKSAIALAIVLYASAMAWGQQEYVGRYDSFAGFSYLSSPKLNLAERGFNGQFGMNINRWLAIGADYSIFTGHSAIRPQDLTPALQARLVPLLPLLGPNPAVQFDSTTYTFTAGPQINFRQLRWVTFFVRPAIGGMHETATLKPNSPVQALLVAQLAPGGEKSDLQPFFGAGGGLDLNVSRHVTLRVGVDVVHVHLFDTLLAEGRNSVRVSVGPGFRFGRNVE
jgi:Outer membrane protein beta-barrel domain